MSFMIKVLNIYKGEVSLLDGRCQYKGMNKAEGFSPHLYSDQNDKYQLTGPPAIDKARFRGRQRGVPG